MSFDDVTVSLLDTGATRERVANGPTAAAGKFNANFAAVRNRVLALKHERDQAQAKYAAIEQRLDEVNAQTQTTSTRHAQELQVARAMIDALEDHCSGLESKLSKTRRELERERALVESLQARLRGLARRGPPG